MKITTLIDVYINHAFHFFFIINEKKNEIKSRRRKYNFQRNKKRLHLIMI